jgi:sugar lactone lactonase YvrE
MMPWTRIERGAQRDILGEGATWCARQGAFYWVDILAPALNRMDLKSGAIDRWEMPEPLGWVVPRAQGGLLGGFRSGIATISLAPFSIGVRRPLEAHLPGNRMNDGKADPTGAIWCGTMDMSEAQASGSLYRIGPDGEIRLIDTGYLVPNGPAFSPCGRWMYHADSGRRQIYRFALEESGARRESVFATFAEDDGYPDGMTTDSDGCLWVAHWDGGRISCFAPDGTRRLSIVLPARRVTNIAFAGAKLDRMFVTSASIGLEPTEFDGALFEVDSGARGVASVEFAGEI